MKSRFGVIRANTLPELTRAARSHAGRFIAASVLAIGLPLSQANAQLSAPVFTLQPVSQTVILGSNLTLTATAQGSTPLSWQWYFEGSELLDATNSTFAITNTVASDAGDYTAIVSNEVGTATSQVASVTVVVTPLFTAQPVSQGVPPGANVSFSAAVLAPQPYGWQWFSNGLALAGATSATLTVSNVQTPTFGSYYWAVVTNTYGSATSAVATVGYSPVVAWGGNYGGQCLVPPSATNVVALCGGDRHALALRADGTVVAWGSDYLGGSYIGQADVPASATNIVGIAAGSIHSLALGGDGTVLLWGQSLGDWNTNIPPQVTNVVAEAQGSGAQHALSLRQDGTVVEWGNTNWGLPDVSVGATNVVAVAAGAYHSVALRGDGTTVAWGNNGNGQLQIPKNATNIVAIAAGWYQNLALRADGTLVHWGTSSYGSLLPPPSAATNIVAIACGGNQDLALRADGHLFVWGDNTLGESTIPPWVSNVVAIAGGSDTSMVVTGGGAPWVSFPAVQRSVIVGGTAYFRVAAVGAWPLAYQWRLNGASLPGATNSVLVVSNAQPAQAGTYSVVVTNARGTVTSSGSLLTVLPKTSVILANSLTLTNGRCGFAATSPAGLNWNVQVSADMVHWAQVAILTNQTGTMKFSGPATNGMQGFYRLRLAQ